MKSILLVLLIILTVSCWFCVEMVCIMSLRRELNKLMKLGGVSALGVVEGCRIWCAVVLCGLELDALAGPGWCKTAWA